MVNDQYDRERLQHAQDVFSAWLDEYLRGGGRDFETLCREESSIDSLLRAFHSAYALGRSAVNSRSFRRSLIGRAATVGIENPPGAEHFSASRPSIVGRLGIEDELARGGMGVIYRVTDHDLSRTLAMKVTLGAPKADGDTATEASSVELARFLDEAKITAQLDHPGVVPVHELGYDSDGHVYFTMKLVKGRELVEVFQLARADKEGWNLSRAVGVMVKACQAVAFAHAKKVVHRDLKPSNIMAGRFGEVYVMDWGLAKVTGEEDLHDIRPRDETNMTYTSIRSDRKSAAQSDTDSPLVTMDGSVVGTPAYMSPEQAKGLVHEVDYSSDVYSLGAILYNLLTGQAPYVQTGARISPHAILGLVTHTPPQPVRELNPQAPAELVAICEKAMARDKRNRYVSSLDLAEDLQAFLDNRVVKAYKTGPLAELRSWVTRNRMSAATVVLCFSLALIGSLFVALRERQNATDLQQRLAHQYFRRGQAACDEGFVVKGLHWFARSLELVPSGNDELRDVIAQNLTEWASLGISPRAVFANKNPIYKLAYSPDNTALVTVDNGGGVKLWSAETGELLHELRGHTQAVSSFAFSPDSTRILTGSYDLTARLWSAESGESLGIMKHETKVRGVAFHSDGTHILTRTAERIQMWSAETFEMVSQIEFDQNIPRAIFDTQRSLVLTAGNDHVVRIWSVDRGEPVGVPMKHESGVLTLAFNPDCTRVLTGTEDGEVRMWSADNETLSWTIKHYGRIASAIFDPQGSLVLTAGKDGMARLWSADTGTPRSAPLRHGNPVERAAFSPNGEYFVTIDAHAFIRVWSTTTGELVSYPTRFDARTTHGYSRIVFRPDGARLALSPFENEAFELDILDLPSRAPLHRFDSPAGSSAFSPDGRRVLTGNWDGSISFWSVETGESLGDPFQFQCGFVDIWDMVFSPNDPYALVACNDGVVRIIGVQDDKLIEKKSFRHPSDTVINSVAFSPDGKAVVTGSWDGTARIWSAMTWEELVPELPHPNFVEGASFSPDGQLVVTGCADGVVRIWSTETGEPVGTPLEHPEAVQAVAISPDGKEVLTGSRDHQARIWNLETRKPTEKILGHHGWVSDVAYSPDGTRIVTGTSSGDVYVWSAATGERVGPPVVSGKQGISIVLGPGGKRVLAHGNFGVELWEIGESQGVAPDEPDAWVRAVTGREMTASGTLKWLDHATWHECRRRANMERKVVKTE